MSLKTVALPAATSDELGLHLLRNLWNAEVLRMDPSMSGVDSELRKVLPDLERVYTDIHAHPELSMQETRTAGVAADRLRAAGFDVTPGVGQTGVVGVLRNGEGPTIMLRADMDALPVREETGLAYASTADRDRQHRRERAGDARVRSRYACDVAHWSRDDHGADA